MTWVAVNKNGSEVMFECIINRLTSLDYNGDDTWRSVYDVNKKGKTLKKGTIKELIGRDLFWEDEPVEI